MLLYHSGVVLLCHGRKWSSLHWNICKILNTIFHCKILVIVIEKTDNTMCTKYTVVYYSSIYYESNNYTVERQSSLHSVLSHLILCHTFIASGVLLLETGNLQYYIWVLHLHLAGKRHSICSPPRYLWNWAEHMKKTMMSSNLAKANNEKATKRRKKEKR